MTYKHHDITLNEWGYYEAYDTREDEAVIIHAKTLEQIKIEIDELNE